MALALTMCLSVNLVAQEMDDRTLLQISFREAAKLSGTSARVPELKEIEEVYFKNALPLVVVVRKEVALGGSTTVHTVSAISAYKVPLKLLWEDLVAREIYLSKVIAYMGLTTTRGPSKWEVIQTDKEITITIESKEVVPYEDGSYFHDYLEVTKRSCVRDKISLEIKRTKY